MTYVIAAILLLGANTSPEDAVGVSAVLRAEVLEVGQDYEIEVEVRIGEGYSASTAGIPQPLLQIDVPPSAKLLGKVLQDYQELAKNEFLQAPFERLIKDGTERVRFKLIREPEEGDEFQMNVLAYVGQEGGDDSWFVRKRIALPVAANAASTPAPAAPSGWGKGNLLQIGDKAPSFILPRADDSKVKLRDFRGEKNVIVTTYRAHW